jgi:hypothetical protein
MIIKKYYWRLLNKLFVYVAMVAFVVGIMPVWDICYAMARPINILAKKKRYGFFQELPLVLNIFIDLGTITVLVGRLDFNIGKHSIIKHYKMQLSIIYNAKWLFWERRSEDVCAFLAQDIVIYLPTAFSPASSAAKRVCLRCSSLK